MMPRKTEGVHELVQDILATFRVPYSEDVIEDVCLAIERNPEWMRRYTQLSDELSKWVVNNWIGQYTKKLTGLKTIREVNAKRSYIIADYTKLAQ